MSDAVPAPTRRSVLALDALYLIMADVRGGLGPFVAIYLAADRGWGPARVGMAMAFMGAAGILFQTPAGALLDRVRDKRGPVLAAFGLLACGAAAMVLMPSSSVILSAQVLIGVASTVFAPGLAAISLGLVGYAGLDRRMGRNQALDHVGNVTAAILAGVVGDLVGYGAIFGMVAVLCLVGIFTTSMIRPDEIDPDRARGGHGLDDRPSGALELFADRRIRVFMISAVLFHFANAAMLPLVGQELTAGKTHGTAGLMSACIVAAQLVMIPVSLLSSRMASRWGRRIPFLIGFAVLPIRGLLYTVSHDPRHLIAIQLLDGIGAGVFNVVGVLMIADLTRGTGRFNLMQGALATAIGVGAAASNLLTGLVVKAAGFDAGFLVLTAIAGGAFLYFATRMPETLPKAVGSSRDVMGRAAAAGSSRVSTPALLSSEPAQ